ncbi:MAG: hypothetical protein Q4A64_03425 [Porphyromonadaceae bacterium]|nr:hypothetical protein [Porphyromonadaceae bacterium]
MNNDKMSNSIIRVPKGNDWHIQLLVSEAGSDQHIDLHDVSDLKVELIHQRCGRAITPPYSIGVSGALQIELEAHQQELGVYDARISFTRPSHKYADGAEHRTISIPDAVKVVHSHEGGDKGVTITAQMASIAKGDKGDPGDPTELLDELSRQQSARMDEIATAQSVSLTSIGARLSDEQRTALEGLAERMSREQSGQIAQQTERLSAEQTSGLQTISDRLSSEQAETLHRQGQERATAQAEALQALDEQVNRKYDTALEAIPAKVTDEVGRLMPDAVSGRIGGEVQAQLSDVVAQQIPEQVEEQLPAQVDSRLPDLVDGRLPDVADNKLPAVIDAKLPPLVDERISGAVQEAMPNQLTTALPPVVRAELPSAIRGELPALVRPAVQPAVEQVMTTDLAARVAQGLQIGTRNLVLRSDKQPPRLTPTYAVALFRISKPWVALADYMLSACISIKSDNPDPQYYVYSNLGYRSVTPLTRGTHIVGDNGWTTSIYRGVKMYIDPRAVREGEQYNLNLYCYTYNGSREYETKVHWIKLEEGTVATEWTPAPEDAYATLCEERLVALSQARAHLWAQYGKITPNSALSSETQTAVRRLWTNYDGAYNRLRKALQGVVSQPSEQAYTALSGLSDQYQTAASDLQAGMTEAMLSLSPAGRIDYDTLAQSITGSIALDSESRLTIGGQAVGESLKGADGRDAEPWDSLFSLATEKDLALPDKVWYKLGTVDLDGAVDFIDAGENGSGFSAAPESGMPYMSSGSVNSLKPDYNDDITQIYRIPIRSFLGSGRRFLRVVKTSYYSESPKLRIYARSIRRNSDNYPEGWSHKSGDMVAYMDVTGLTDEYVYVIMANSRHRTWLSRVDVWTDTPIKIEYYGTWLAKPKSPKRAQHYLCSNIAVRAGASYPIALYYTGHKWVTAWGATIQGETTEEAQQAFNVAVQALKSILSDA